MSYDPNEPQTTDKTDNPQSSNEHQPDGNRQQRVYNETARPQQPSYHYQLGQQPPSYGQQVYGSMPQQQPRRSRRVLWIVLGIIAGLIVAGCVVFAILFAVGAGFLIDTIGRAAGPNFIIDQYYNAIEKQDYSRAYSFLSPNATTPNGHTLTQQLYVTDAQVTDVAKGRVSSYTLGNTTVTNDTTRITVSVTRNGSEAYSVHLTLQQVNGDWKIITYDNI